MADNAQIKAGITISADTEGGEEISRLAGEINSLAAELAQINAGYRELQKSGATQEELAAAAAVHAAKVAEVNGKLKEAVAQSEKLKKIADAKTTLGLDVKDNLRAELKKVDAAYQTLKASGKLTGRELRAATEAHRAKVAQLRTEIENADTANRKMGGGFGAAQRKRLPKIFRQPLNRLCGESGQ